MTEVAGRPDARDRGFELLDARGVRKLNPVLEGGLLGGLWCRNDAVLEPGSVLTAFRSELEKTGRYQWLPGRRAVEVLPYSTGSTNGPVVVDHLGQRHHGAIVLLCIGDQLTGLAGPIGTSLAALPLRRCRLHMMQTAPPGTSVTTAVADADSMRYYPAFALPGRALLPHADADVSRWSMQLLLVQRAGGGLTIGDTHVYDEPFDFGLEEDVYDRLRDRAESLLGWPLPRVVRRWTGTYTLTGDDRPCYRGEVGDGVWLVTGTAGRGMTLAPAIAEQTWEQLGR
jgi:glycine/D-amino acid oxidase-like deaminating enzyme